MRKIVSMSCFAAAMIGSAASALAAQGTIQFTGAVTSTCVLTVGAPGVLAPNTDFTQLNSQASGGSAGTIAVLSTGSAFKVSTVAPTSFTSAPATGGDSVNYSTSYQGSGATSIGSTPGTTATTVNTGLTNLSVNLLAQKSAGTFAAGAYVTVVIVRCE